MSVYQKQHYEDVARVLNHARSHEPRFGTGEFTAIGQAIINFADLFAKDNPQRCYLHGIHKGNCGPENCPRVGFDRKRFLVACGLEEK